MPDAPYLVSDRAIEINLTGYLMPAHEDRQPVLLHMAGAGSDLFLPVFSTLEKLVNGMELAHTPYARVQKILDGGEFLDSLLHENETRLRVIIDFYQHENGKIRFQEVFYSL